MKNSVETQTANEAVYGILPTINSERKYGFFDAFLVTGSYGIATWCYAQGAVMAEALSFKQLFAAIFAPNIIVLAIASLIALFAVRYGVDYWQWLATVFGTTGKKIVCALVVVMILPWFAVNSNMVASSMANLVQGFGVQTGRTFNVIVCLTPIILGYLIAIGGLQVMKWTGRAMIAALVCMGAIVVILSFRTVPVTHIINFNPNTGNGSGNFMWMVEACLGFAASWTTGIAVIPRLCKTERAGYWSAFLGYGLFAPLFVLFGGIMAIVMFLKTGVYSDDVASILNVLGGGYLSLLSLVLVVFANVGTGGVGTYMYGIVLKSAFPRLRFKIAALIVSIIVAIMVLSEKVMANFLTYLSYSAYLFLSIISILLVDLFIVRSRKISLRGLYETDDCSYRYSRGFNVFGLLSLIVGIVTPCFIYNPMTGEVLSPIFYYTSAGFLSFVVSGTVYFLLSLIAPIRAYLLKDR